MIIEKFSIKPNKENVLRAVGCVSEGEVYETVSRYFDEIIEAALSAIEPYAAVVFEGMRAYCLMTAGGKISDYSKSLFDSGEAMKGLLADATADEYLFEMDKILSEKMKTECAKKGFGVKSRLDAPKDFPLSEQKIILEKTHTDRVTVTDAFMLEPVKSIAYILELTDDKGIFNAQHDCSKCTSQNCPRRTAPYTGEILLAYDYVPPHYDGKAVCIDIGTTTIAMEYQTGGGVKKSYKTLNPQRRFGADVLSRIEAANRGRGDELNSLIRFAIKKGIGEVTDGETPDKIIIAGNTTMVHLLMNYPCDTLGEYPFKSDHLKTIEASLGNIPMTVLGGISAFVGGDIVSGLYMCDFDLSSKVNLFIDLGTNGEMAIGNRDRIIATSTAAGPAFEGGRLSSDVKGTDIIEIMADMVDGKIMDSTGKLTDKYYEDGYKWSESVTVLQQDIREIQMAKAAVRAGIECLTSAYGVSYDDIGTVYLAGGMGYWLSPEKAARIGLLPAELKDKTKAVGNSSLGGAVKYACEGGREHIENIQKISREFPLAQHKDFDRLYIKYMNF